MLLFELNNSCDTRLHQFQTSLLILSIYTHFAQAKVHRKHLAKLCADLCSLVFAKKDVHYKSRAGIEKVRQSALRLIAIMVVNFSPKKPIES
jgi:hypothetical protein